MSGENKEFATVADILIQAQIQDFGVVVSTAFPICNHED
jgi:hypothetical protein